MSNSRLEKFIYAICGMDIDDLPTPLSRIETLWNCLITGEVPDFEPLSRNEKYLMAMLTGDVDALPEPTSRSEKLLYKIATGETDLTDVPGYLSRYEELLKQLIESGGIGGTDFEYVLYTLNQPLSTLYSTAEDIVNTATIYGDTVVNTLQEPSDLAVTPIGENIDTSNTTINGTIEGKVKSAILKGQTLVNQSTTSELTFENVWQGKIIEGNALQSGKKYFVSFDLESDNSELTIQARNGNSFVYHIHKGFTKGKNVLSFILEQDANGLRFQVGSDFNVKISNIIILEYQDGMENWNIPYFEGMQSVKMPVLTTTGKNLLNPNILERGYLVDGVPSNGGYQEYFRSNRMINVSALVGKKIYFVAKYDGVAIIGTRIVFYDSNKNYLSVSIDAGIVPDNAKFVKVFAKTTENPVNFEKVECCLSTINTYEPYKSNILSCNEEVTLRGIGEVKDTLDGNTGELTQRIGEVVLDGSENWEKRGNTNSFWTYDGLDNLHCVNSQTTINCLCDMMESKTFKYAFDSTAIPNSNVGVVGCAGNKIAISFGSTTSKTLEQFKQELSLNPITVQYELETPTIKTVVLSITDQDGKETSHLHAFNDTTHISTSAECLLPNVVIPADISYPSIVKANTLYTVKLKRPVTNGNLLINLGGTEQPVTSDCFTIQTPATLTSQNVIFSGKGNVISEVTVVEGDHTEKEYGYFEGMMSVKMPVLTTTGKNLANSKMEMGNIRSSDGSLYDSEVHIRTKDYIPINDSIKTVTLSNDKGYIGVIFEYDKDYKFIKYTTGKGDTTTATLSDNCRFVKFRTTDSSNATDLTVLFQLEQGTQATTYEPYKSNILSTPSDLELRGIGDVKDTVNCLTGEVVENTIKLTFSGIENWETSANLTNYMTFRLAKPSNMITADSHSSASKYMCDKLQIVSSNTVGSTEIEAIWFSTGHMYIRLPKTKASSLEEFKTYLSTNNIQVVSCAKQPVIKTVVLSITDQDGQPTKLSTFNDVTHVSIESNGLIPTVDLEVPTKIEETLSTLPTLMNDISETQQLLNESIDDQAENINEVSTAITEIHNDIL